MGAQALTAPLPPTSRSHHPSSDHGCDEGDEGDEGQGRHEQRWNRRCAVRKDWPQEEGVLRYCHRTCSTWRRRSEEERKVHPPGIVFHQDPPEASYKGREEGDVRTDRDGEGNEGKDSGEGQACVRFEECGLRQGWGKPCLGLQPALCSFVFTWDLGRLQGLRAWKK